MSARAVRYEDFADGAALRKRRASDRPEEAVEIMLARARGQARADGFADGVTQTEARIDRELEARIDAVLAALDEARAARAAAKREAAEEATTILKTFLDAVAPRLAEFNLAREIVAALDAAFAAAPEICPKVEIAPARRDQLTVELGPRAADIEIVAAPDLGESEARVSWRGGFDLIDTAAAIRRALDVLDAHLAAAERPSSAETME
ncbi:hypothetical protein G5B40_07890 [Pikeienuella piscinae]|uniref:Flagellar assembly protein FliH/Type III secretion system HrpE domain-containing protein n=1 Tax=Pikeienuella piscinae TaxID=2748098 RepID=A0A7L5BUC7_9RHOB|nr:hypothetical protein [Pikeienuella piscinae]QIE55385.1 hypothetical protein G5B40_07890 [Pikeienuella piscinae]